MEIVSGIGGLERTYAKCSVLIITQWYHGRPWWLSFSHRSNWSYTSVKQTNKQLFSNWDVLCYMLRFRCECQHHTCGETCDRCCAGYNQRHWRPATREQSNECEGECWGSGARKRGPTHDPHPPISEDWCSVFRMLMKRARSCQS